MHDVYIGIDWATTEHAVCVLVGAGRPIRRFMIEHTEEGLDRLLGRLGDHGPRDRVPVAIERPDGLLVDQLLEAGHPVVPVKPAAIREFRRAEVPSGAKSDSGDAEAIAEYLRLKPAVSRLWNRSANTRALRQTRGPERGWCGAESARRTSSQRRWSCRGPERWRPSLTSTPTSRSHSCSATPPAKPQPTWDRNGCNSSWTGPATAAAGLARTNRCSQVSAPRPKSRHRGSHRQLRGSPRSPGRRPRDHPELDQTARPRDRVPARRASGRRDLPIAATLRDDQRRPTARRVG